MLASYVQYTMGTNLSHACNNYFIVCLTSFVELRNDFVMRQSAYITRQFLIDAKYVAIYYDIYSYVKG